jgi:hypothetical protein
MTADTSAPIPKERQANFAERETPVSRLVAGAIYDGAGRRN